MKYDPEPQSNSIDAIAGALKRARRIAANLSDQDDRRVIDLYVQELEAQMQRLQGVA
ncbi:MAG TPA: hypothetical protein VF475_00100 [Sphingobium sp.]